MQMLSKVGFVRIGGEGLVGGFDGMAVDRGIDIRLQIAGRAGFQEGVVVFEIAVQMESWNLVLPRILLARATFSGNSVSLAAIFCWITMTVFCDLFKRFFAVFFSGDGHKIVS